MRILTALTMLLFQITALGGDAPTNASRPPNFVFILGEGHGWSSTSVDMDGTPPSDARPTGVTPNLEALAAQGMRFSDFYASCPRCTPSRASFLTGISPAKLHMTYVNEGGTGKREGGGNGGGQGGGKGGGKGGGQGGGQGAGKGGPQGGGRGGAKGGNEPAAPAENADASKYPLMRMIPPSPEMELPADVKTTGDVLRGAGYATAHFGKWHAGRMDPTKHGFDVSDGPNTNQGPDRGEAPNPKQSTAITDRGIDFMRQQVKEGKPFFLQLSHYGCGSEAEATPESVAEVRALMPQLQGKQLGSAAGMRDMDKAIGRVMAALKELGIADHTYVFFSTDHGTPGGGSVRGVGANPPLTGAKGSVSDGGIRVPFLAWGPGVKAGTTSHVRATGMDLLPTMLDLAGKPLPKPEKPDARNVVEGGSLTGVLKNGGQGTVSRPREEIVVHFPHYDLNNGGPASAIFVGDLKLIRNYDTGKVTLYDIVKDPGESRDLAAKMPDKVKDMEARLDAYLKAVDAQMPRPNPEAGKKPDDGDTATSGKGTKQNGKGSKNGA